MIYCRTTCTLFFSSGFTQTCPSFLFYQVRSFPSWSVIIFVYRNFFSSSSILLAMLSSYVAPFLSLQYPTRTPAHPDSFPHSTYYTTGKLDICLLISFIAVMALLRDAFRLWVFEPLARWKLLRDLELKRERALTKSNCSTNGDANHHHTANGNGYGNGNGHANGNSIPASPSRKELRQVNRSVLRFAEQGWSVVYYSLQWSFGLVRIFL